MNGRGVAVRIRRATACHDGHDGRSVRRPAPPGALGPHRKLGDMGVDSRARACTMRKTSTHAGLSWGAPSISSCERTGNSTGGESHPRPIPRSTPGPSLCLPLLPCPRGPVPARAKPILHLDNGTGRRTAMPRFCGEGPAVTIGLSASIRPSMPRCRRHRSPALEWMGACYASAAPLWVQWHLPSAVAEPSIPQPRGGRLADSKLSAPQRCSVSLQWTTCKHPPPLGGGEGVKSLFSP